jgi:hypothetical protein
MRKLFPPGLALAGGLVVSHAWAAQYADGVADYQPGTGYSAGYLSPATALGAPAQADSLGTPVDPFNAPWETNQLVSIGAGGRLTVQFGSPILNDPTHPGGRDFIIYGNTMFMDVDWPNGRTDETPSLFGDNPGSTRVWVSADGSHFYQLNPALTPGVDGLFPTDAQGTPGVPVNPALAAADFASRNLAQIRALYAGSAGGTSFDIGWAQDDLGQSVNLASISYVRVEVLSGHSEVDAFAEVVPEPRSWLLAVAGLGLGWLATSRKKWTRQETKRA